MYVTSSTSSTAVSCGLWSASTVIVNSCSAVSPSVSVTRHVYVVAACAAVGVPDSVRVGVSNVSPAGGVPTRRCVSGAFPPVPSGSTSGVIADPAMYVTSSTAVSCGLWSASTVIVNSCSAVSPSVSVTRHVYVVAACAAVGVPDSVRVGVSNVSPAGGVPTRRCVKGAFPPVPSGSTSGVIADPAMYVTSSTAVSCGLWSPSTVIVNSCSAVSPSVSVTRHVYVVADCAAVGVPDSVRVGVSNVSPAGGVPTSACVKGAFPPVPSGSTSGVIADPAMYVTSSTAVSCGLWSPSTVIVNSCSAVSPSVSVTRHVYVVAACAAVGVPDSVRVGVSNVSPAGGVPTRRCVKGAFPPVPSGSTSGVIADPAMYVTSSTAVSCGLWSASTVIVNSCSAVSPSVSVTRHVYVVAACAAVGVPDSVRVGVSNVSPAGGVPTRRCVSGAFPPVPSGSTSGVIGDPAMYVTSSTAVSCGLWSASTVIVNSCSAVSPSVSVTRHVYVVAACAAVGVPDSVRVGVSNVSPAGGLPTRRCVSGAFPPVPSGSTSGVIADPAMYVTSSTAVSCGLWSASTVIVNSCSAVSPSVSVTRHVYVVADCAAVGVPDSVRVGVSNVSPAGGVPTRRCVRARSRPSPPAAPAA